MNIDEMRVRKYLNDIKKNSSELRSLIENDELVPNTLSMKAAKYMLVELAEAISGVLQHILAREKGIAVSGYVDTIIKARDAKIISEKLFERFKPFFDFRNSLIHRYWIIDDEILRKNILEGINDFDELTKEIEQYFNCT